MHDSSNCIAHINATISVASILWHGFEESVPTLSLADNIFGSSGFQIDIEGLRDEIGTTVPFSISGSDPDL